MGLDVFWAERLAPGRKATWWDQVLTVLVIYRLIDLGSEWRLHREWYERSAMGDLLGQDYRLTVDDTRYRCLDKVLARKEELFGHLQQRWKDLFGARFEVLLYDLTSMYFESDPPIHDLVGTPKGRLSQLEAVWLTLPWQKVRPGVEVKLLTQEKELYVLAQSHATSQWTAPKIGALWFDSAHHPEPVEGQSSASPENLPYPATFCLMKATRAGAHPF